MFFPEGLVQVFVYGQPVNMRLSFDGLYAQVRYALLIASDEVVRNVLRAVRALPSRQPEQAAVALSQHFAEMTLPKTRPPWGPEDAVDY